MTGNDKDHAQFHWAEGMKYVSEGLKALFLLNGFGTISILTFIGNENSGDDRLVWAMLALAGGALLSICAFFSAYLTQLNYGNDHGRASRFFHNSTYRIVLASLALFASGIVLAGLAFTEFGD